MIQPPYNAALFLKSCPASMNMILWWLWLSERRSCICCEPFFLWWERRVASRIFHRRTGLPTAGYSSDHPARNGCSSQLPDQRCFRQNARGGQVLSCRHLRFPSCPCGGQPHPVWLRKTCRGRRLSHPTPVLLLGCPQDWGL